MLTHKKRLQMQCYCTCKHTKRDEYICLTTRYLSVYIHHSHKSTKSAPTSTGMCAWCFCVSHNTEFACEAHMRILSPSTQFRIRPTVWHNLLTLSLTPPDSLLSFQKLLLFVSCLVCVLCSGLESTCARPVVLCTTVL